MKEDERINHEIKNFLQYTSTNPVEDDTPPTNNITHLSSLLKDLNRLYDTSKHSEPEAQVLCNKIISLIKSIISDRKEKETEINESTKKINKLENQIVLLEDRNKKEKDEVKYKKMDIGELERLIKDLNNKVKCYKSKNESLRKNADSLKAINDDLVNVKESLERKKCNLEEQIGLFDVFLKEKEEDNKKLRDEKKESEKCINKLKDDIKKMEEVNESLKLRIDEKNNSLNMLNDEMANLLRVEKTREGENKTLKERTEYYERLYKSVAKQNEYLNEQLSKMINVKNIDMIKNLEEREKYKKYDDYAKNYKNDNHAKDEEFFDVMTKSDDEFVNRFENLRLDERKRNGDEGIANFMNEDENNAQAKNEDENNSKYKKYKKRLLAQKRDNERLKKEIGEQNGKISNLESKVDVLGMENEKMSKNHKKLTNDLFERIEKLMKQNRMYQENIFELKNAKRSPSKFAKDNKYKKYEPRFIDHINKDDSFKTVIGNVYENQGYAIEEPNKKNYDFKIPTEDHKNSDFKSYKPERMHRHGLFIPTENKAREEIDNATEENYNEKYNFTNDRHESKKHNFTNDKHERGGLYNHANDKEKYGVRNERDGKYDILNDNAHNGRDFKHDFTNTNFDNLINEVNDEALDQNSDYTEELRQMKNYVKSDEFANILMHEKDNNEIIRNEKFENIFEDTKSEHGNVVEIKEDDNSTTSSLRNMIKKTDKLKERFTDLEEQLNKIKGDGEVSERRQINPYENFYLSDAYDYKNDPDAL